MGGGADPTASSREGASDLGALSVGLDEAVRAVRASTRVEPRVGIVSGQGFDPLPRDTVVQATFSYADLPMFRGRAAAGGSGRFLFGTIGSVPVVAAEGRFLVREGHSLRESTLPVRLMCRLGAGILVISEACGSLSPR
jgi:purine-nucleoside phosphorylase